MASLRNPSIPKPTGAGIVNLKPRLRMADGGVFSPTDTRLTNADQRMGMATGLLNSGVQTAVPSIQSTPISLGMADGGVFDGLKRAIGMAPPETMIQKFARQDAERAAKQPQPVAPAPQQAPAPVMQIQNYGAGSADARMKALGLRDGGSPAINQGKGGPVPGTGSGDKIPAKYEPGEFVVSNDMLDADPSLRGELHGLRTAVLAKKGMTPQEADAKAVQPQGLRAQFGYDPLGNRTGEENGQNTQVVPGNAAQRPGVAAGSSGLRGPVAPQRGFDPSRLLSPTEGIFPGTRAVGRGFAEDAGAALREPTTSGKVGQFLHAAGKATLAAPLGLAEDILEPATRTFAPVAAGAVNTAATALTGNSAPVVSNNTALPPLPNSLRSSFAPSRPESAAPAALTAPEEGKLLRSGNSFSGNNISGLGRSVVPGMSKELINQTLTNPDGSRWSAADNAVMAANLRDGVDPYRGTSRQPKQDSMDSLRALAMDPNAIGRNRAARMLMAAEQNQTQRRGQDMQSADQRYNTDLTSRSKLREMQYTMAKDQRDFDAQRGDKAFEQSNAADKAQNEMFGQMFRTRDNDGKDVADTNKIARYTTNVQNTLPDMVAALKRTGTPEAMRKAAEIEARGMAALDKSDHAKLAQYQDLQDRLDGTHGSVVGSTHKKSASLLGYAQKAGSDTGDGNVRFENGSYAPMKHLSYDEPGNLALPDWFKKKTDQYTRGMTLRTN